MPVLGISYNNRQTVPEAPDLHEITGKIVLSIERGRRGAATFPVVAMEINTRWGPYLGRITCR